MTLPESVEAMKTLGEKIRELREAKDLSLRELAKKLDVSPAFLSDVELGRRQPSDKHLTVLVRVLETSMAELKQYDTRPPVQEFRRRALADPEYGFAFRRMVDENVSSKELLEFIEELQRKKKKRDRGPDKQ